MAKIFIEDDAPYPPYPRPATAILDGQESAAINNNSGDDAACGLRVE